MGRLKDKDRQIGNIEKHIRGAWKMMKGSNMCEIQGPGGK